MRVVDTALLAMLATTGLDVNDTFVDVDNDTNVVEYPTPFLFYAASIGDNHNPRLSGQYGRLSKFFTVGYIGLTPEQAMLAGQKARAALCGKRVSGAGIGRSWLIGIDESQRVRRDDDAINPDGRPLFAGFDLYSVSVTLDSTGVPG